jgi:hypothetical protein
MKTTLTLIIALAAAAAGMLLAGCGNAVDNGGGGNPMTQLHATWVSEGADVAPLLAGAPFNNVKITATFKADGTYDVIGIDSSNKSLNYTGTYVVTPSSVAGIMTIRLTQVMPQNAVAEGMYQIDTSVTPVRMQYEVVQTQPTNGLVPPTPEQGFGSTLYNGKPISTLIQKYSRQ